MQYGDSRLFLNKNNSNVFVERCNAVSCLILHFQYARHLCYPWDWVSHRRRTLINLPKTPHSRGYYRNSLGCEYWFWRRIRHNTYLAQSSVVDKFNLKFSRSRKPIYTSWNGFIRTSQRPERGTRDQLVQDDLARFCLFCSCTSFRRERYFRSKEKLWTWINLRPSQSCWRNCGICL